MLFSSTRHTSPSISFTQALWQNKAPDGGLYIPNPIPLLPKPVLANMPEMTLAEIAYVVFKAILGNEFSSVQIKDAVERAYNFPAPVRELDSRISVIELFEGRTLSFKDFGARITARFLEQTLEKTDGRPVKVLIATTGNTGGAIANALSDIRGIDVYIVFPRGTATRALENQFTTPGGNIHPIEISGSIDACYTLVATALSDVELKEKYNLLSLNSGNVARLIGQTVYYFYGVSRIKANDPRQPVVVSLPCGNLGNLTAGVIAKRMGLDIERFIACENNNDYLHRALLAEDFTPRAAAPTIAYAADKSVPTNIERILDLYGDNIEKMNSDIDTVTVSDPEIIEAVRQCYDKYGYTADPHTAMAYFGMKEKLRDKEHGLIMATAHPAKSLTAMTAITGRPLEMPNQLNRFTGREDHRVRLKPAYQPFKQFIIHNS